MKVYLIGRAQGIPSSENAMSGRTIAASELSCLLGRQKLREISPMSDEEKQQIDSVDLSGKREGYEYARLGRPQDHWHLHAVCIHLPTDYEPYGFRIRTGPDCSCGCKWFLKLQAMPMDWGVCANPQSPRCGLLTFEHQGCAFFTPEELETDEQTA